jgi:hypothetical protein
MAKTAFSGAVRTKNNRQRCKADLASVTPGFEIFDPQRS